MQATDIREELALSQEIACAALALDPEFALRLDKCGIPAMWLSPQQRDCLVLAAKGHTAKASGESLGIKASTVVTHRKVAVKKLNCKTLTHAACKALHLGLIPFSAREQSIEKTGD